MAEDSKRAGERNERGEEERESEKKGKKRERCKVSEYKQATEGSSLPARSFGTMIRSKIFARKWSASWV